ncbi:MAG: hypothetical protein WB626_02665 [Bacteroidota bacterium]
MTMRLLLIMLVAMIGYALWRFMRVLTRSRRGPAPKPPARGADSASGFRDVRDADFRDIEEQEPREPRGG